jgi:hypothetical protein
MRQPGEVQKVLVAIAAWTCVGTLIIGLARVTITPFGAFLDHPSPSLGSLVAKAMTLLLFLVCLAGWVAALWHVAVYAPLRSPVQRAVIIGSMLVLNLLTPLVYYFVYLLWLPKPTDVGAAV